MLRNLIMFGMMGALGIPVLFLTLILLVEICGVSPVLATSVGYLIGALVNYTLNYRFTFKSSKPHRDSGPKFFLIALMTGILNALLVYLGVNLMGMHYLLVQIFATLIVFLSNFVLHSTWTFRLENIK